MRQRIITLGIVFAGIFTTQAQEVKFGVRTGLNLSDLALWMFPLWLKQGE